MAKIDYNKYKVAVVRFLRTFLPQVPAVIAEFSKVKPEWVVVLSFAGAVLTALDKFLRDSGTYEVIPFVK